MRAGAVAPIGHWPILPPTGTENRLSGRVSEFEGVMPNLQDRYAISDRVGL
jgi:hypothetical protein